MTNQPPAGQTIPPALAALPQMLKDGNLPLIVQALDNGDLATLPQYLTGEQMREFEFSVRAGDIEAARNSVAGVEVPGVGVLWPKKSNPWPIVAIVVIALIVLGLAAWFIFGGSDDQENIPDTLSGNSNYTTFAGLIDKAGLTSLLSETGPYTVFAPDNSAFEALPADQLEVLDTDNAKLRQVVQYHITTGELSSDDLPATIKSDDDGAELNVEGSGTSATINGTAKIIDPDIEASNGLIQGIDSVLIPPGLDLTAPPSQNVLEVISSNPDYSTLTQLMTQAGLSSNLSGPGPQTLFAPDNAAFSELSEEQLAALSDETLLRSVLNYHISPEELTTSAMSTGQVPSAQGAPLDITVSGDNVTVNGAQVVDANLAASNGVVQGINRVLVPPGVDLTTTTSSTESTTSTTESTTSTTESTTSTTTSTTSSTTTTSEPPPSVP